MIDHYGFALLLLFLRDYLVVILLCLQIDEKLITLCIIVDHLRKHTMSLKIDFLPSGQQLILLQFQKES